MYEVKFLDDLDFSILVAIKTNIDSCSYLAALTGRSKQVVSLRISALSKNGLVVSEDNDEQHFYKKYKLTKKGLELIKKSISTINYNLTVNTLLDSAV